MKTLKLFIILSAFFILNQLALSYEYKVPQHAFDLAVCDIVNDGDFDVLFNEETGKFNENPSPSNESNFLELLEFSVYPNPFHADTQLVMKSI